MQPKVYSYIRFSTPEQAKGDTLRRQAQAAEDWAQAHGLILDKNLRDEGLSAYKGVHKVKGALGRFLKLIEAGKVPKGSVLIVEELDRLSREKIMDALATFTDIIRAGVGIVTLMGKPKLFTETSLNQNPADLIQSISSLALGHQESEKKSNRLRDTWDNKRNGEDKKHVGTKLLTNKCPAWLEGTKGSDGKYDWKGFKKIPKPCEAIQKIFSMKAKGVSAHAIERKLNDMPSIWRPKSGWRKSYIDKILRTPAVIGEFQPHRRVDKKRLPVGIPIPNYFPPIVNPDLFYSVQEKIKINRQTFKGGRTGKVSNLFAYLTKCGYCHSPMQYISKGQPPKGGAYLVCDKARRRNDGGCKHSTSWRYSEFEKDWLEFFSSEIDVSKLLPDHDTVETEIDGLKREKESIQGQLSRTEKEIKNLTSSIKATGDKRVQAELTGEMSGILNRRDDLIKEGKATEEKINVLERSGKNVQERIESMKELMAYLKKAKSKEVIDIRFKLRGVLREAIDEITVFSKGFRDKKHVDELYSKDRREIFYEGIQNKDWRFYRLQLKGCRFTRALYPAALRGRLEGIDQKEDFS